ncbi:hypothetical protein NPIL_639121 [Nephila pilipes]|uniref:Uncharacterized protein n=1 Tax=Nephila pilipes TaxID=299642 RepID=A0A8X6QCX8_NEPPI|nr:hypothetical protein NPIL_639121 [Nephila pilipes]
MLFVASVICSECNSGHTRDTGGPLTIFTSRTIVTTSSKLQQLLNVRMGRIDHKLLVSLPHILKRIIVRNKRNVTCSSLFSRILGALGIVGSVSTSSSYKYSISESKVKLGSSLGAVFTRTGSVKNFLERISTKLKCSRKTLAQTGE